MENGKKSDRDLWKFLLKCRRMTDDDNNNNNNNNIPIHAGREILSIVARPAESEQLMAPRVARATDTAGWTRALGGPFAVRSRHQLHRLRARVPALEYPVTFPVVRPIEQLPSARRFGGARILGRVGPRRWQHRARHGGHQARRQTAA